MQSFASASSTYHTFIAEETREILLIAIVAIAWWYLNKQTRAKRAKPPNPKLAKAKCLEEEDVKLEGSSSEPESELSTTEKVEQTTTSLAVLESDLSEPESQDKIDSDNAKVANIAPAPGLVFYPPPGLELPCLRSPQLQEKARTRKKKPKSQQHADPRELGRCVCWKDCFGFIVDESGARLFVRQTDIEGEKTLMSGQVVWFRRGKQQCDGKTKKAQDVSLIDIELAKMLRAAEKDGMSWTAFRQAVIDGDTQVLQNFKSLKSIANHKTKLGTFKAEAIKGPKDKAEEATVTNDKTTVSHVSGPRAKAAKEATAADVDLKAFLGSGSTQEMKANLKYVPQWVAEKLSSED